MSDSWTGLTAIVTGGTGALGTAVVRHLLDAGASVHVTWVLEKERASFVFADRVTLHHVDVADEAAVASCYRSITRLDASIHLVGGFAMAPIESTSARDFESMWRLNALSCFLCCREAVRKMRANPRAADDIAAARQLRGRIVNVAARPVIAPVGGMIAYAAAKAAVASITQSLAQEVLNDHILVNAVLPSIMDTPANRAAMSTARHDDWPKVADVAAAIAFLAGPANTLTSGAHLPVFGRA